MLQHGLYQQFLALFIFFLKLLSLDCLHCKNDIFGGQIAICYLEVLSICHFFFFGISKMSNYGYQQEQLPFIRSINMINAPLVFHGQWPKK